MNYVLLDAMIVMKVIINNVLVVRMVILWRMLIEFVENVNLTVNIVYLRQLVQNVFSFILLLMVLVFDARIIVFNVILFILQTVKNVLQVINLLINNVLKYKLMNVFILVLLIHLNVFYVKKDLLYIRMAYVCSARLTVNFLVIHSISTSVGKRNT